MPPDEPAMPSPPAPRKRTQFASFLTDAASDLSGFEPSIAEDIGTEAKSVQAHGSLPPAEAQPSAKASTLEPPYAGDTGQRAPVEPTPVVRRALESLERSAPPADAPGAGMRTSAPNPSTDTVKISVKVDAVTFLELKRALRLRETLQDFCLNAITRELGTRTGQA